MHHARAAFSVLVPWPAGQKNHVLHTYTRHTHVHTRTHVHTHAMRHAPVFALWLYYLLCMYIGPRSKAQEEIVGHGGRKVRVLESEQEETLTVGQEDFGVI